MSVGFGDEVSKLAGYRAALIECSVIINAALTASILRSEFCDSTKDIRVVFGVYGLASRHVHVPLLHLEGSEPATCLLEAPKGREEFGQFAYQVASRASITQLLR